MVAIKVEEFGGMIPLIDDYLLKQNNASYAENSWLLNGRIAPVAAIVPIYTLQNSTTRYAYRIPLVSSSVKNIADSQWLEFDNADTVVVKSPVTGQDDPRYYWTDGQNPPGYTTESRITADDPRLLLGIPFPNTPPSVTVAGGTGPVETRAYTYTWVSAYGEEGQPAIPTVLPGNVDGVWTIGLTPPTSGELANRDLATVRIYRTVTSTQGMASFFFVVELPIATLTYDDSIPDGTVAENNELASTDYEQPATDLKGMVPMPNGIMVGWRSNQVWFSEPYLPHAWPTKYMLGVEAEVIGVGVWGQSAVILSAGQTYVVTGITPDAMALSKIAPLEPVGCKGSIVNTPKGVVYASQNGLIQISPYGGQNVTTNMFDKSQFPQMLRVEYMHAAWLMNGYFTVGGVSEQVFQDGTVPTSEPNAWQTDMIQLEDYTGAYKGIWVDYIDPRVGVVWFPSADPIFNVMQDNWTGEVLIIRNGQVQHIDFTQAAPRNKYRWRSKEFQMPYRQNWGAARIFCFTPPGPPLEGPTVFRFICDGMVKFQQTLSGKSGQVFRMPSGFKPDVVQFELEGYLDILNVQIGQSPHDLRQV
jgi:hypothetical protein